MSPRDARSNKTHYEPPCALKAVESARVMASKVAEGLEERIVGAVAPAL